MQLFRVMAIIHVNFVNLSVIFGLIFTAVMGQRSKINSMKRDSILMNTIPTASALGTWNGFSLLQCTTICLTDVKCTMVFHNNNLKLCKAYVLSFNAAMIGQQSQNDWQFYHRNLNLKVCPTYNGYSYNQILDRCVKASNVQQNYVGSHAACSAEGAVLARVDNNQMWQFVKDVFALSSLNEAYIQGEMDQADVRRYEDGTPIQFINWAPLQPDPVKREPRLMIKKSDNYRFHDCSGNSNYGYICEINLW